MTATDLLRPDLRDFVLYSSADGSDGFVRLHANELPWRRDCDATQRGLNRYPESRPAELRSRLAALYAVNPEQLLLTRGSDDGIDLLVRAFCRAGLDNLVSETPGFAMYAGAAGLQGAGVRPLPLDPAADFVLTPDAVLAACDGQTRLVFLCSPHNPSGRVLDPALLSAVANALAGRAVLVIDEAYAEFSRETSAAALLPGNDNVVVLRTLSKAYGLAGLRIGALLAAPELVAILNRLLTPYPLPSLCIDAALANLGDAQLGRLRREWADLCERREVLRSRLAALPTTRRCWDGQGNFVLLRSTKPDAAEAALRAAGILVRRQSGALADCLRITVGNSPETAAVVAALEALR